MRDTIKILKGMLETTEGIYIHNGGKPDCRMMEDLLEDVKALKRTISLVERECRWREEEEIHSEITLEIEQGKDIPLSVWARKNGIEPATARQKAGRGAFKTAHKEGRDWFINELELNIDNRRK